MQGLNDPVKCRIVIDFLGLFSVGLYCLLETKVHERKFGSVSSRFNV